MDGHLKKKSPASARMSKTEADIENRMSHAPEPDPPCNQKREIKKG